MLGYLIRRIIIGIVTVWAISVISFIIIRLPPGDFVSAYIAQMQSSGSPISAAEAQNLRIQYGLDQPLYVQYFRWMLQIAQGNLGFSMLYQRPAAEIISDRLALTIVVTLAAVILIWLVALPVGILSAVRQYSLEDYVFTLIAFLGVGIPNFLLALGIMYLGFAWFNTNIGGLFSPEYQIAPWGLAKVVDLVNHLWLPAIILGFSGTAQLIRIMRNNLLDELYKPYVLTARAKGLSEFKIIVRYPVRVALNPFVSTVGYTLPYVVSGSIIVSVVMGLPTVGPLLYQALIAQDMYLAGAIVLLIGTMTVIGTLLSDILLIWADPRIRLEAR